MCKCEKIDKFRLDSGIIFNVYRLNFECIAVNKLLGNHIRRCASASISNWMNSFNMLFFFPLKHMRHLSRFEYVFFLYFFFPLFSFRLRRMHSITLKGQTQSNFIYFISIHFDTQYTPSCMADFPFLFSCGALTLHSHLQLPKVMIINAAQHATALWPSPSLSAHCIIIFHLIIISNVKLFNSLGLTTQVA